MTEALFKLLVWLDSTRMAELRRNKTMNLFKIRLTYLFDFK